SSRVTIAEPRLLAFKTSTPDGQRVIRIEGRTLVRIWPGPGMGRGQVGSLNLEDADGLAAVGLRDRSTLAIAQLRLPPPALLHSHRPDVVLIGSPLTGSPLKDLIRCTRKVPCDLLFI